jgi:hypothetical protein
MLPMMRGWTAQAACPAGRERRLLSGVQARLTPGPYPKESVMNLSKTVCPAIALCLSALAFQASAQTTPVRSSDQIDNQYKMDKKQCDGMKGNQKDVCQQQAEANRDKAKADAKAGKEKAEANHDAAKTRNDADYKVGKEKCDAMSGNAKDACMADLKTRYGK